MIFFFKLGINFNNNNKIYKDDDDDDDDIFA